MATKGKSNEEVQAEAGQAAGETAILPDAGAPEAEAVVADGDRAGDAEKIAVLEDGADAADRGGVVTFVGDTAGEEGGDDGADASEGEAERPEAETNAPALADAGGEGVTDGTGNLFALVGSEGAGAETRGSGEGDVAISSPDADSVSENGGVASGDGVLPDAGVAGTGTDDAALHANDSDGSADGVALDDVADASGAGGLSEGGGGENRFGIIPSGEVKFPPVEGQMDMRAGMFSAACTAEFFAAMLEFRWGGEMAESSIFCRETVEALHDLVMKIGERATPDVMAHQLVIRKLRSTADLTTAQRIGLDVFGTVARLLDERERQIITAYEADLKRELEVKPLPVEETMLETADGPLDIWGGA